MLNFVLGIIWGFVLFYIAYKFSEWKSAKKIAADISSHFKEVLSNLKMNQAVFVSRVNQTVIVDTRLAKLDVVNIVYLMDKQQNEVRAPNPFPQVNRISKRKSLRKA